MGSINRADLAAGLLFVFLGAGFGVASLAMDLGSALRMGPGYFPLLLSVLLVLLGLAICVDAFRSVHVAVQPYAWRGMVFILGAPIFFGLTVRGLGFVPSIFLTTLLAALAGLRLKPLQAGVLALAVMVFCTLVFSLALGLPFRRFGPWLTVFGG